MKLLLIFILLTASACSSEPILGGLFGGFTSTIGKGIGAAANVAGGIGKSFIDGAKTTYHGLQSVFQNLYHPNVSDAQTLNNSSNHDPTGAIVQPLPAQPSNSSDSPSSTQTTSQPAAGGGGK